MNVAPLPLRIARSGTPIAILAAAAAPFVRGGYTALVAGSTCTGLPDLLGILVARSAPSVSPFVTLQRVDSALLIAGVFLFVRLAQRVCASALAGAAVVLAIVAFPTLAPSLGGLPASGFLAAALAIATLWPAAASDQPRAAWLWITLAFTVAISPILTVPCIAALVTIAVLRRSGRSLPWPLAIQALALGLAGLAITRCGPSFAVSTTRPETLACLLPPAASLAPAALMAQIADSAMSTGPYVCGLAALGLFLARQHLIKVSVVPIGVYMLGGLLTTAPHELPAWSLVVGLGAAAGLREVVSACRPNVGGRLAAATLVALVPVLSWSAAFARPKPPEDFGHRTMTLTTIERLLDGLPANGQLVSEDASTLLLLRAASRQPQIRVPDTVPLALLAVGTSFDETRPLFALPLAQDALQYAGFRLVDTAIPGLAEVHRGGTCRTATGDWRAFDPSNAIALVARQPVEAGPVVLYVRFASRPQLQPLNWPSTSRRGFYTTVYAPDRPDDQRQLREDEAGDRLPLDRFSAVNAYVARLELWRIPSAPLVLATAFGATPNQIMARVIGSQEPRRLTLCPAFPHTPGVLLP